MRKKYSILIGALIFILLLAACGEPKIKESEVGHEDDVGLSEEGEHSEDAAPTEDAATVDTTGETTGIEGTENTTEPATSTETQGDDEASDATPEGDSAEGADATEGEDETGQTPAGSDAQTGDTEVESTDDDTSDAASEETSTADEVGTESDVEGETDDLAAGEAPQTSAIDPASIGDPAHGEELFAVHICNSCHMVDQPLTLVGPSLQGVASRAATRVEGLSVVDYLRQSIVEPDAYVVDTFPMGVMPQTFGTTLTEQEINDLIAYMLTLK